MAETTVNPSPQISVSVQDGPASVAALDWPGPCGGECVFLGRTRHDTHTEFGPLLRLEYEVYEPMAQNVLQQLAREAVEQFGCHVVRIVHAKGSIEPGEASVVIQVATPHRSEAFDACRFLIDALKHKLPVWKREVWREGQTFVEGCCADRSGQLSGVNHANGCINNG